MEERLIIFLAFVAVTLFFNTVMIYLAYKAFAGMTAKVTNSMNELETNSSIRRWLGTLESASAEAARVTGDVKKKITSFEPELERIQTSYSDSLSKADVRIKLVCRAIHFTAGTMEALVKWPVKNIFATSAAIQGVIAFLRGSENGPDARPRRTR